MLTSCSLKTLVLKNVVDICSPLGLNYWPLVKSYDTTQEERFKSYHMFVSVLS